MSEADRIHGRITPLDYSSTLQFFEKRAQRYGELGPLSVTMYQDHDPALAIERDRWERDAVLPLLGISQPARILDIGCGIGRWAGHLEQHTQAYLGIDFSSGLIDIARQRALALRSPERFVFQCLSAVDVGTAPLALEPPFDLILVAGVMVYLNDEDCEAMLAGIATLAARECRVYIREPVAVTTRLTLERFFSTELRDRYSAIYRTQEQYDSLFSQLVERSGFEITHAQDLFPAQLHNRRETAQRIFLFSRAQ